MIKIVLFYLVITVSVIGLIVGIAGDIPLEKGSNITVSDALIRVVTIATNQSRLQLISLLQSSDEKDESREQVTHKREIPPAPSKKSGKKHSKRVPGKRRVGFTASFITNYMKKNNNEVVDENAYEKNDANKPVVKPLEERKESNRTEKKELASVI